MDALEREDIAPFKAAIRQGAECIMVGHLVIKRLNKIYPASLSYKIITKILREKLAFKGVVITDDLSMKGITFRFGIGFPVVKAIKAGADIVVINKNHDAKLKIIRNIKRLILRGKIS